MQAICYNLFIPNTIVLFLKHFEIMQNILSIESVYDGDTYQQAYTKFYPRIHNRKAKNVYFCLKRNTSVFMSSVCSAH